MLTNHNTGHNLSVHKDKHYGRVQPIIKNNLHSGYNNFISNLKGCKIISWSKSLIHFIKPM